MPPCQPWSDLDFPRSFPLVAPVPLCATPDVPCLVLPFQTMVTLSTLDLSGWMPDGFLVLIQWSHLSLECLRHSRLNVGPLFQPMAFPAKTDLTTGLAFGTSRDPGKASTFTVPLQPCGLSKRRSRQEGMSCAPLLRPGSSLLSKQAPLTCLLCCSAVCGGGWNHPHLKVKTALLQ